MIYKDDFSLTNKWTHRLDRFCAITAGLLPIGVVVGNAGFEGVVGLVGICWITRCCIAKQNPLPHLIKHPLVLPWTVWYLTIVISMLVNGGSGKGWAHDFIFIRHLIFLLALLDISQRVSVAKYFLNGLVAGVILAAINTVSAYLIGQDLFGRELSRYSHKVSDAGRLTELLTYAAPFLLAWAIIDKTIQIKRRSIVLVIGVAGIVLLFVSQIRTSIIASLLGILFAIYIRRKLSLFKVILFLAFSAEGMFFLFLQMGSAGKLSSLMHRFYIWEIAWQMFLEHPLVGVGASAFREVYSQTTISLGMTEFVLPSGQSISLTDVTPHAHNLVLQLLSCTGVLGFLAFSWLFINSIRLIVANHDNWRAGLLTWPVVFFFVGLTGWDIYGNSVPALLVFFIVLIGINNYSTETFNN